MRNAGWWVAGFLFTAMTGAFSFIFTHWDGIHRTVVAIEFILERHDDLGILISKHHEIELTNKKLIDMVEEVKLEKLRYIELSRRLRDDNEKINVRLDSLENRIGDFDSEL